jgi:hypothetical protein
LVYLILVEVCRDLPHRLLVLNQRVDSWFCKMFHDEDLDYLG